MKRVPRLLLAEHEESQPSAIRRTLEKAGLSCLKATSGLEALEVAKLSPDSAIIELQLPDLDGREVCRRLKSHPATSQFPVILVSHTHVSRAEILRCFESGAVDYIAYPVPDEELLAKVTARIHAGAVDSRWTNRLLQQQTEASQTRIARLKAALEIAQLGIWELTAQLGVWQNHPISAAAQFDKRCLFLLGISQEHPLLLEEMLALIHPQDRDHVRDHISHALGIYGSGVIDAECRLVRPDGTERWIAMRAHEVKSEISKGPHVRFVGTIMDISERKRALELLIRSEKVAALGQMAATLAHEINNPLAAVVNALYLARSNVSNTQDAVHYLQIAEEQVSQVTHITRQALGFYRERSTPAPVSVVAVLKETVGLLRSKIGNKKVVFESEDADKIKVIGVSGELRQVFSNLIANSLEAIADDGTIRVRISRFAARNGSGDIRITVADDGKGITPSSMTHLFEPLFTTKGVGGTGLGLWVSKQIVEKHGGSIRVRSRTHHPRRGTVFAIFLPAAQGDCVGAVKRVDPRLSA
jgi:PAS domain S-box-containing protein